jgi:hypothetical protein
MEACASCRGQYSQLSSLSAARAVSMEWERHSKAAPGERPPASLTGWFCPAALAGLEPTRTPERLSAARATPTDRGKSASSRRHFATYSGCDPVPRALSPLMARAARSQCAAFRSFPGHDQAVWHPGKLCSLARVGDGLTPRLDSHGSPSSRTNLLLRVEPHGLFPRLFLTSFSLLPVLLSILLFQPSLTASTSSAG